MESEVKALDLNLAKESADNFENTMILNKSKLFSQYNDARHERDIKLVRDFLKSKQDELEKLKGQRDQAH